MTELKNDPKSYFEEWLVGREWKPGELSSIIALPSRGMGKSVFRELYMQRPMPQPTITGTTANTIVVDEVSSFTLDTLRKAIGKVEGIWLDEADLVTDLPFDQHTPYLALTDDVRAEFHHDEYPEADTFVILERLDKRNPRHPNPAAGDAKLWFVKQGHKKIQVKNLSQAKRQAEHLHLQTIAKTKRERDEAAHQARLAHEEALRVAAENEAHLKAHPAFGGF